MLVPIYGGSFDTYDGSWPAQQSVTIGKGVQAPATQSLSVRGPIEYTYYRVLEVGVPVEGIGEMALAVGSSEGVSSLALGGLTVNGTIAASLSRMGVSVAPPLTFWPARMGLDVVSSGSVRGVARGGVTIFGASPVRMRNRAVTVRAERTYFRPATVEVVRTGQVWPVLSSLTVGRTYETLALSSIDVRTLEGFTVLADIIGADIGDITTAGPDGYFAFQDITCQLLVEGTDLPVKTFDIQAAPDKLGMSLNVALATVDVLADVPVNADVQFDLIVTDVDGVGHPVPIVAGGKIGGRDITIQWGGNGPGDELTIAAIDVAQDKFGLAPRQSIIMFDPEIVNMTSVEVKPRDAMTFENGAPILPLLEPREPLTAHGAMKRAYTNLGGFGTYLRPAIRARLAALEGLINGSLSLATQGLGFANLITNIPDYPVSRVDISNENGWHDGCQPLVAMYNPIYFVEFSTLFIMYAENALPAGFNPRVIPADTYALLGQSQPYRDPFNAVILTYQARELTDAGLTTSTEWLEDEVSEVGTYGQLGYQRTVVKQQVVRVRDEEQNIVSEEPERYYQDIYAATTTADGTAGPVMLIHHEEQQDFFSQGFKTGHKKEVKGLMLVGPEASLDLVLVLTETCEIAWKDDTSHPGQRIQTRNHTRFEGLIYESTDTVSRVDPSTGDTVDTPKRYPALVAQSSGIIQDDGRVYSGPYKTITETLRTTKGNQLDVNVIEVDLLTGTTKRSKSDPRISSGLRSVNKYEVQSKSVMIRDLASEAEIGPRIPVSVNAGELPKERAFELAHRILRNGTDPQEQYRMNLPGVDLSIRRGSVIRGQLRDGSLTPPFMVKGFTISGQNLGRTGHRISMNLEGVELR
jgi:hypothetical protein